MGRCHYNITVTEHVNGKLQEGRRDRKQRSCNLVFVYLMSTT